MILPDAVQKACSQEERAPQRRFLDACIDYTWDKESGREFWREVKLARIHGEVQAYKVLFTVLRVIQEGHPSVFKAAEYQLRWLRQIQDDFSHWKGYGQLIRQYSALIISVIEFHRDHVEFNGKFELEKSGSLPKFSDRAKTDIVEGLMSIQADLIKLESAVFDSLQSNAGSECRLCSLIPLIAMSYGVFRSVTLIASRMATNKATVSLDARITSQYKQLKQFYANSALNEYLKRHVSIPHLSDDAPSIFGTNERPSLPPRPNRQPADQTYNPFLTTAPIQPTPTGNWWAQDNTEYKIPQQPTGLQPQMTNGLTAQYPLDQQAQAYFYQQQQQQQLAAEQQELQQQLLLQQQLQQQQQQQQLYEQANLQQQMAQQYQTVGSPYQFQQSGMQNFQPQYYY